MNDDNKNRRQTAGMTLAEAAPELYAEVTDNLERGNMSAAGCVLNDDEIAAVIERLKSAVIREMCDCSQVDCKTYYFDVPEKLDNREYHTVRLNAHGDLMVHIDADCDVFKVQRLYDLSRKESTRYVRNDNGEWERVSPSSS